MNTDFLFNINLPSKSPQPGVLLVAEPFLREEYFRHAVILMVECPKDEDALGVVLNRATNYTLDNLVESIDRPIPVFCGGPCAMDRLYFLHTLGDIIPEGRQVTPGLWLSGDFDAMLAYVRAGYPIEGHMRFFLGYSGWAPGQLDEEMKAHTWAVVPPERIPPAQLLSDDDDRAWHTAVRQLGPAYRGWLYHPEARGVN